MSSRTSFRRHTGVRPEVMSPLIWESWMGKRTSHPLLPRYIRVHTWWDVSEHTPMRAMYQVIAKHVGAP